MMAVWNDTFEPGYQGGSRAEVSALATGWHREWTPLVGWIALIDAGRVGAWLSLPTIPGLIPLTHTGEAAAQLIRH